MRGVGGGLPLPPTASASRRVSVSRLNTRRARPDVNASRPPSGAAAHYSGPVGVLTLPRRPLASATPRGFDPPLRKAVHAPRYKAAVNDAASTHRIGPETPETRLRGSAPTHPG